MLTNYQTKNVNNSKKMKILISSTTKAHLTNKDAENVEYKFKTKSVLVFVNFTVI